MDKIGLFYGSDTGATEYVADLIIEAIGKDLIDRKDVYKVKKADLEKYDRLILQERR